MPPAVAVTTGMLTARATSATGAVTSAAVVAAPGFAAFLYGEDGDPVGGDGIGPPPAERRVEGEAGEENGRQVGAQEGLGRVGDEGVAVEGPSGAALGGGEDWHDDEGCDGDGDAGNGLLRPLGQDEVACRADGDVAGEREERGGDESQRGAFAILRSAAQLPYDDRRGGDLDERVESEDHERDRPGGDSGSDGDQAFENVPGDGEVLEAQTSLGQVSACGHAHHGSSRLGRGRTGGTRARGWRVRSRTCHRAWP